MKKILTAVLLVNIFIMTAHAQVHRFDPPWNTPPASAVPFTVPDVDWSGSGSTFYINSIAPYHFQSLPNHSLIAPQCFPV
jgi:hypothetical protein